MTSLVASRLAASGPQEPHAKPSRPLVLGVCAVLVGLACLGIAGTRQTSETILLGSTAQRVQHSAPCPVLV